jgi:hypothetical protein
MNSQHLEVAPASGYAGETSEEIHRQDFTLSRGSRICTIELNLCANDLTRYSVSWRRLLREYYTPICVSRAADLFHANYANAD